MLCEWFLKQFWYFIAKQGLLDEQDIFILEESFTEVTKCSNWFAFELTTLIIPSTSFLVIKGLSLNSVLIASTFVLFPFPIFYAFPKVICWFWATTVDERFRNFLQGLRQKELCLFSLQHSPNNISNSIGFMLPLRKSRLNCFKQLRTFIQNYNLASKQFTITNSDRENLLFNFIGDEMHNLVCSDDQECTEEGIEEKLGTSVLKTLWQFMFLVRSEFLRLSILKLQNDICHFHPIDFIQHFYIFLRTILATSSLNINTNCWEQRKTKSLLAGGTQIKITQFKFCRAQMEWALERLELLDEKCASGEEEEESFLRMGIIGCLEQIIQRLKNDENFGKSKIQTIKNCHERLENYAKNNKGIVGMDSSEKMEQENLDDFKIYEVDLAQNEAEAAMEKEEENEKIEKENATSSLFFPFGAHNAVQNELRHALCQRKDYCLQRELTALARLRGISPSEIAKEELDRTPFSASVVSHSKTNSAQNERHPSQINHGGPFGRASLNSSDLNLILSQRLAMFGTDDEKTAAQPKNRGHHHRIMLMEAYGENDSEEENEEEDENR